MSGRFVPMEDANAFEGLLERSEDRPVLLFKHDPPCSISVLAHRELARLGQELEIPLIDVARSRSLSLAIAKRTGVVHESPQVIVLRGREVAWSASHFGITTKAVAAAIAAAV